MDLAQKPIGELYHLASFASALSDALRDVDDTTELRAELDSFSEMAELEMSSRLRM